MEQLEKTEHEQPDRLNAPVEPVDRFKRIKEMIDLPEDDVSATREPREADDKGLPLMLMLIMGIVVIAVGVMGLLFFGISNNFVNIILGNHFMK